MVQNSQEENQTQGRDKHILGIAANLMHVHMFEPMRSIDEIRVTAQSFREQYFGSLSEEAAAADPVSVDLRILFDISATMAEYKLTDQRDFYYEKAMEGYRILVSDDLKSPRDANLAQKWTILKLEASKFQSTS